MQHLSDTFRENTENFLENFSQFIAFRTVSSNKELYREDFLACTQFIENLLKDCCSVEIWSTEDAPAVLFAYNTDKGPNYRTLLIYCHYDVQPADIHEGWSSDPFSLTIDKAFCYGRGVSDNKGQCFYTLWALRDYFWKYGAFPCNIKIIIEGEEETGSNALKKLAIQYQDRLQADDLLVVDGGFSSPDHPGVSIGARGIITGSITIKEASKDLHSGLFGGAAYNPNRALSELLASLHYPNNVVAVEDFYTEVSLEAVTKHSIYYEDITETCVQDLHFYPYGMEEGFSVGEAVSIRPTLEITGIQGGYTGEGFKTIVPAKATAYLSCRLVPFQDPETIWCRVIHHLVNRLPKGLHIESTFLSGSPAWLTGEHSLINENLKTIYAKLYKKPCHNLMMGGSIPIVPLLARASNASPLICGVSYATDNIHAPNEKFSLEQLENGYISIFALLESLII